MSFTLLGILNSAAGGATSPYYFGFIGAGTDWVYGPNFAAIDSDGNNYALSRWIDSSLGYRVIHLAKIDPLGSILWQKAISPAASSRDPRGLSVVGSKIAISTTTSGNEGLAIVYDTSGNLVWERHADYDFSAGVVFGIAQSSSNDVYISQQADNGGTNSNLSKWNNAGGLQWDRTWGGSVYQKTQALSVDSSGNVYGAGYTFGTNNEDSLMVVKWNSSGTIQWQRYLGASLTITGRDTATAIDSNDNLIVLTKSDGSGLNSQSNPVIAKYDSSGSLLWQRYAGSASGGSIGGVTTDINDNILFVVRNEATASTTIVKFNSNGTVLWQREVSVTDGLTIHGGIATDSLGDIYFTSYGRYLSGAPYNTLTGYLPADGSLEGSYSLGTGTVVYSAGTLSIGTSTLNSYSYSRGQDQDYVTARLYNSTHYTPSLTHTIKNL